MSEKRKISGTREWAAHSVNCVTGCAHNCRYCYARYSAVDRYKHIQAWEWPLEIVRQKAVNRPRRKLDGRVMFPTTHDITPRTLSACLTVLCKLLAAGNDVLIVSKPHFPCIQQICSAFDGFRSQITFRFTIGASNDAILEYWEPGAPTFTERLNAVRHAYGACYQTSVSMEPLLDPANVVETFNMLAPYVTDSIWIGMMNNPDSRVKVETLRDDEMLATLKAWQTPEKVRWVYEQLKDRPLVKWKESYKRVLGLPLAEEAGKDI